LCDSHAGGASRGIISDEERSSNPATGYETG
jgi:hypothetical protein